MSDTNQPFWDEFKAMFADPVQRKALVAYFDECKDEHKEVTEEITIALVGCMEAFSNKVNWLNEIFPYSHFSIPITMNLSMGFFEAGNLRLVRVCEEKHAYGKKFDAFVNIGVPTTKTTEASFFLVAHNTKRLGDDEFFKLIKAYFNHYPCPSN